MVTVFSILSIIASIILVLVVLIQKSKGGGLSSNFSSSNQIMGAPKTADFLEKATWGLAIAIMICSLASAKFISYERQQPQTQQTAPVDNTQAPDMNSPQPTLPAPMPAPAPAN
ncbi:preprotein translocase subunit SecG [Dysgonomonas macrotermitis]|uniref:Protein-export membrane protein SecG n=1 Tax=Dysgonomonas macrotermitis TaxID=1346286 RepID=A0A1M4T790_9BACT|nr:preprotein translocase subunit SecG [Dysgonomonas macrotermitis]SHE40275.1 protein translocase subunit secG [Dysgonomonas macrotermitis]